MKQQDLTMCKKLLSKVSRSFALTIPMLDDRLYHPIMVAYLQYRLLDNFEDELSGVSRTTQTRLMDTVVRAFDPDNDQPGPELRRLEEGADLIDDPDLQELTEKAGLLRRAADSLEDRVRDSSFKWLVEMNRGMQKYLNKPIATFEELDEYCYYVAGTVGGFLTDTIIIVAEPGEKASGQLRYNFRDSGLFLQKVNLIRDIKRDIEQRNKNFWPLDSLGLSADQLLDPACRKQSMQALERMLENTRQHIAGLVEYMEALPGDVPGYRRFFAVNNALGLATLEQLENNPDLFYGERIKVSKMTFLKILKSPEIIFREKAGNYLDRVD